MRGGAWETLLGLPPGTTKARLATALALPLLAPLGWHAVPLAVALFLGMASAGWGHAMDIGRMGGSRLLDALAMSGQGLVTTAPALALALAWGWTWWPLAAAGPTEWAECAVGAGIAAALWAAAGA